MDVSPEDRGRVKQLAAIVEIAARLGVRRLSGSQLTALPRLYRFASSLLARVETRGGEARLVGELRPLLFRAHGLLHRHADGTPRSAWTRAGHYLFDTIPRAVRSEWKLVLATFGLIYGLAILAHVLVSKDLGLAYSLLEPSMVDSEVEQLRALTDGESFRGNFTFGKGQSAGFSGRIMGNNMRVALLFFAMALVPPIYLLVLTSNALMLGTYTGIASHWDQAGSISSIIWCHGVLEIQAIVLAGTAGLVLLRAWVVPGPWTRAEAMRRNSRTAIAILAATFPMLFFAGLIEGFVSPHASFAVRVAVAVASGLALVFWLLLGGRRSHRA